MLLLLLIEFGLSQYITLTDSLQNSWVIYNTSGYNPLFFWPHEQCCTPPQLVTINATQQIQFQNTVTLVLNQYNYIDYKVNKHYKGYITNVKVNGQYLYIDNICDPGAKAVKEQLNESGIVYLKLIAQNLVTNQQETMIFHYWFNCIYSSENLEKINFDLSMQIVIVIGCLCVWLYAKTYKIRSIKIKIPNPTHKPFLFNIFAAQPYSNQKYIFFQGFNVTWVTFILFIVIAGFFYLITYLSPNNWYEIVLVIIMIIAFISCWFFFDEIFYFLPATPFMQKQLFGHFKVCDLISIILSSILVITYLLLNQPWYVSTIIAFCITGAFTRIFKVLNLKQVVIIYSLIILYDIILLTCFIQQNEMNYEIMVLMNYNYPVYFEIPQFEAQLNKLCCWISVLDLLIPALCIAYLYRYGKNLNTVGYFYVSIIGLFLGIMGWAFIAFYVGIHGKQIAQSFVVLPILVLSISLWALRQGEFLILWRGEFYDRYLQEDFSLEYEEKQNEQELSNKVSEQKQQINKLLEDFID